MAERQRSGRGPVTTTRNEPSTLDPREEQVVRMRHGYRLPDDAPLPSKAEGNAQLAAALLQLEQEAFEKSGRLQRMKDEADAELAADAKRQKIVDQINAAKKKSPKKH